MLAQLDRVSPCVAKRAVSVVRACGSRINARVTLQLLEAIANLVFQGERYIAFRRDIGGCYPTTDLSDASALCNSLGMLDCLWPVRSTMICSLDDVGHGMTYRHKFSAEHRRYLWPNTYDSIFLLEGGVLDAEIRNRREAIV